MIEIKTTGGRVLYTAEDAQDVGAAAILAANDGADLRAADLGGANLYGANLYGANLRGANLRCANLYDANLRGANLYGANLYNANLYGANLCGANLYDANLYGANLRAADLGGANLRGADLRAADLGGANLYDANLGDFKPDSGLPKRVAEQILASPEALNMSDWHTCDTSHCLAGWAVHLSGPPGYALEAVVGPEVAGRLLMPSASHLFHASDDEAREWAEQILAGNEA